MEIALYGLPGQAAQEAARFTACAGHVLSRAIWLSGRVAPQAMCSGLGRCGRCRVRFLDAPPPPLREEEEILGPEALALGWRLACRHRVPAMAADGCLRLELPAALNDTRKQQDIVPWLVFKRR